MLSNSPRFLRQALGGGGGAKASRSDFEDSEIARATQFICWAPRSLQKKGQGQAKLEHARKGGSHNHWPTHFAVGVAPPESGMDNAKDANYNWNMNIGDDITDEQQRALGP